MTVAVIIEHPITQKQIQVPHEIVYYCDNVTVDADPYDLRYLDCVYMHMGYYGNNTDALKQFREEYFSKPRPVFE